MTRLRTILVRVNIFLSVFIVFSLTMLVGRAEADPVTPRCDLANALRPEVEKIAGEIYGLTSLVQLGLIILVSILVFAAFTIHGHKIIRIIAIILASLVLLSVISSVAGIFPGAKC